MFDPTEKELLFFTSENHSKSKNFKHIFPTELSIYRFVWLLNRSLCLSRRWCTKIQTVFRELFIRKFVFVFKVNVEHRKFSFLSKIYSLIIYFDLLLQMERGRCRRISTSSIQSNSSIANAQCSDLDTHAIVQRETDKKVVLIPLENFINFGKVIKVNDTATFKGNKDSRKVDRGKVLVFGESLVHKYIIKLIFCLFHWRQRRDVCRAITSIARRIFWWKSSVR